MVVQEAPNIRRALNFPDEPSKVTCGDFIESLLALAAKDEYNWRTFAGISIQDGATFWGDYVYHIWRCLRVREWHNNTHGAQQYKIDKLLPPAAHTGSPLARNVWV